METLNLVPDPPVRVRDYRIGCIGAGMIMADCHLAAYAGAGFEVVAIASRTRARAEAVAERWSIPKVLDTPEALIADAAVEIVDIAYPPDQQPALIRAALKATHLRAILAQKPLALSLREARALSAEAAAAGKMLCVNQNMRYDQSMRALRQLLDAGALGRPVFAQIDMHAIPHWQGFLADYDRLTLANMSVHHLDVLRYLFGDPAEVTSVTRTDPRTGFAHQDGIVVTTLRFASGLLAISLEDVWSGPRAEGYADDQHIRWRVEGHRGRRARAPSAGPRARPRPSTTRAAATPAAPGSRRAGTRCGFPHAFAGVMEQMQYALASGTRPALDVADNVATMALVEAA